MSQLTLTKIQREQVAAIEAVFAPWGLACRVDKMGKHAAVFVTGPSDRRGRCIGEWRIPFAGTPRDDGRAIASAKTTAQRVLREINEKWSKA